MSGPNDREIVPDKEAALILLHDMLEREPYVPKQPSPEALAQPADIPEPDPVIKPLPPNIEEKIRSRVRNLRGGRK